MKKKASIIFLLPALVLYTMMKIYPMLQSFVYSFTDFDGIDAGYKFIGIGNYIRLFSDERFTDSLLITFAYVLIVVAVVNILGFFIALLLNNTFKASKYIRAIFFMPVLISQVAAAFVWKIMFSYNGILDYIMRILHLSFLKIKWISDPSTALYSVCIVEIWVLTGFYMVILMAALQTIPNDIYEAAEIDGVRRLSRLRYITLPLAMPGMIVSIMMSTIAAMKQFDIIKVLTEGGPAGSTEVISYVLIDTAFNYNMQGYATAMGVVLVCMILFVIALQKIILGQKVVEY